MIRNTFIFNLLGTGRVTSGGVVHKANYLELVIRVSNVRIGEPRTKGNAVGFQVDSDGTLRCVLNIFVLYVFAGFLLRFSIHSYCGRVRLKITWSTLKVTCPHDGPTEEQKFLFLSAFGCSYGIKIYLKCSPEKYLLVSVEE